jgi:hypothetical protein
MVELLVNSLLRVPLLNKHEWTLWRRLLAFVVDRAWAKHQVLFHFVFY